MRRLGVVLGVMACGGPGPAPMLPPAEPSTPVSATTPTPPTPTKSASRRCGEAGEVATELPPQLATGRVLVGAGVVKPDDSLQIGTVALKYDPHAWVGTMRAGSREPALNIEIDRAEVGEHQPWGAQIELYPGAMRAAEVGPYHIVLHAAAGAPPAEVAVTVTREVCPAVADLVPGPRPQWLWLSSEGIRFHREPTSMRVALGLDLRDQQPWLTLESPGYRQGLALRPGPPVQVRLGADVVTIERVEVGADTRFDGRWSTDGEGEPRVHVLARIEPGVRSSFPAAVPASSDCGEASPVRSGPPAGLTLTPTIAERRRIKPGEKLQFGPLTLDYGALEIPAHGGGPYREEARQVPWMQVLGPDRGGTSLSGFTDEHRLLRILDVLLRVGPEGKSGKVRAERVALRCLAHHMLPPLADPAPIYLWLGTLGHTWVRVGDFDVKALNLQVYLDRVAPSLSLASEHGSLIRPLGPDLVGLAVTLDDHLVEVVDVDVGVAGPEGLGPPARVQLRVTPRT